jgi:Tol biopolymer transport system component/tRNA A-37 threonylcarbamoyl transferase component Bud32
MNATRWRLVEELYHAARERGPGDKRAFLADACHGDEELRREVESLLAQDSSVDCGSMPLAAGARLGPYEILAPIGAGGMGEVWKARDTRLNREVAVKISNRQFTDRFEREARAIAALNHLNICTLFDVGPNYLVMELIDGPTLADRIAQGPVPLDEALAIARQIADALEAAHDKNIVHRDLKPGNVKIRPDGSVKVLDFGLAKAGGTGVEVTSDSPALLDMPTAAGVILGTAAYMAPEQAQGKTVDKRADIWSFGVVLYEMVTGKRLFRGEDLAMTLASVVMSEPDLTPAPAKLRRLLARCLQKDPRKRLHDIGDAWELLEQEVPATGAAPARNSVLPWAAAGVLALGAAAVSYIHFRETAPQAVVARSTILPPAKTSFQYDKLGSAPPAVSPDGRLLVFGATSEDGHSQLYVRPLDTLAAQPLAGTEGAIFPFWSPDSRSIGFGANGKLKKIDAAGGPAVTLADAPALRGGTWSQNGVIVFAPTANNGVPLRKVAATGGNATDATSVGPSHPTLRHRWPWFLPDGRHFLYIAAPGLMEEGDIRIGSLENGEQGGIVNRVLGKADSQAVYSPGLAARTKPGLNQGYLVYLRDQSLVAQAFDTSRLEFAGEAINVAEHIPALRDSVHAPFAVSPAGVLAYQAGAATTLDLVWLDRGGKRIGAVIGAGGDTGTLGAMHISPDRRLAALAVTVANNADIWIYDLARGTRSRFTSNPAHEAGAVWSPDGKTIVFNSDRRGHFDLYRKAVNSVGTEELLYADGTDKSPTSWSADGKYVLYSSIDTKGGRDIFVLPLFGERKPFPFVSTEFWENFGQFSPDGRWVAYQSNESGRTEIYVAPFPGPGGKPQISTTGGMFPHWRADGRELFYQAPDQKLMVAEIGLKPDNVQVGAVRPLFELPWILYYHYDVSTDGQRFLAVMPPEQTGPSEPLTLVQNWQAGLKK